MMLFHLWMPLVLSLVLWTGFEQLLIPRPRSLFSRPLFTCAIDIGSWALLYAAFVLLLERPWFATVLLGALHMVLIQVSNTKANTLREPFLCQDFEYFIDMVKHPRLYLPFFGIGLAIGLTVAAIAAIVAFFWFEPSVLLARGWQALTPTLELGVVGTVLLALGIKRDVPNAQEQAGIPLDPNDELRELGFTTLLWRQGRELVKPLSADVGRDVYRQALPSVASNALPHVVITQSESFFDPRRWYPGIKQDVLSEWDAVAHSALQRGTLNVPAWGANTVRSECAFLTGLRDGALAGHRFNPYHSLSHQQVPSLARQFKQLGYRTLCIHPYPKSFYFRDKVFPLMGFDEFEDIQVFSHADKDGQYIGDQALARRVKEHLEAASEPMAIMLITMENHGPLHLEAAPPQPDQWYQQAPGSGCEDLAVYLRHVHNCSLMVKQLSETLEQQHRDGILCFYGDHVPIMDKTYRQLGNPDGTTDYFIWSTTGTERACEKPLDIAELGPQLLHEVLTSTGHGTATRDDAAMSTGSGHEISR